MTLRPRVPIALVLALATHGCDDKREDLPQPEARVVGLTREGLLQPCVDRVEGATGVLVFINDGDSTVRVSIPETDLHFTTRELMIAPHQSGGLGWQLTHDAASFVIEAVWAHGWSYRKVIGVRPVVHDSLLRVEGAPVSAMGQAPGHVTIVSSAPVSAPVSLSSRGPFDVGEPKLVVPPKSSIDATFSVADALTTAAPGEQVEGALRISGSSCGTGEWRPLPEVRIVGTRSQLAKQIVAGAAHACALAEGGRVWCWGTNVNGELGIGDDGTGNTFASRPVPVTNLDAVDALAAGNSHSLALRSGKVICWGRAIDGECGGGAKTDPVRTPVEIPLPAPAVAIHSGASRSCAVLADGRAFCWGKVDASIHEPTELVGTNAPRAMAIGSAHTCVLSFEGVVACAGAGGRLGDGTSESSASFEPLAFPRGWEDLVGGDGFSCARTESSWLCWGAVPEWGVTTERLEPSYVASGDVASARASRWCIGDRSSGVTCHPGPDYITGLGGVEEGDVFANGLSFVCRLRNGRVVCASSDAGQLVGSSSASTVAGFDLP